MNPNSFFRDVEIFGDLAVAAALGDTSQDFRFPRCKFNGWHAFRQAVKGDMWKIAQTAIDILNGV